MVWIVPALVFLAHAIAIQRSVRRKHWETSIALAALWGAALLVSVLLPSVFPMLGTHVAAPALAGLLAGIAAARIRRRVRRTI